MQDKPKVNRRKKIAKIRAVSVKLKIGKLYTKMNKTKIFFFEKKIVKLINLWAELKEKEKDINHYQE